jgi:hypothetical protein
MRATGVQRSHRNGLTSTWQARKDSWEEAVLAWHEQMQAASVGSPGSQPTLIDEHGCAECQPAGDAAVLLVAAGVALT